MNKNILFLSYFFSPENTIGAIRISKIAKYISKDYNVKVICADKIYQKDEIFESDISAINTIFRVMKAPIYEKIDVRISRKNTVQNNYGYLKAETGNRFKKRIYIFLRSTYSKCITIIRDIEIYKSTKKFLKTHIDILNDVDVVISSYGPKCNHEIAIWIKKNYPHIKWIADFRDGMAYSLNEGLYKKYVLSKELQYVQNADAVTIVANGCISYDAEIAGKLYIIHNGFDFEDTEKCKNLYDRGENRIIFSYTGAIFTSEDRNAALIFRVLKDLVDEGFCTQDDFFIKYAGPDYLIFLHQASYYGFEQVIVNYGVVSRKKAIEIQLSSDVLIHLTSYNKKGVDILSGKLFEYMMMKKEIVSIVIGKYCNSLVKRIIDECKLGICCEEASFETDYKQLKLYFKKIFNEKKSNGIVSCHYDEEKVSKYDYRTISKQFKNIINILLEE